MLSGELFKELTLEALFDNRTQLSTVDGLQRPSDIPLRNREARDLSNLALQIIRTGNLPDEAILPSQQNLISSLHSSEGNIYYEDPMPMNEGLYTNWRRVTDSLESVSAAILLTRHESLEDNTLEALLRVALRRDELAAPCAATWALSRRPLTLEATGQILTKLRDACIDQRISGIEFFPHVYVRAAFLLRKQIEMDKL